jgi:hypothetical protein
VFEVLAVGSERMEYKMTGGQEKMCKLIIKGKERK